MAAGVAPARAWLADKRIARVSIVTEILPNAFFLCSATRPARRSRWISTGARPGPQSSDVVVETDAGTLRFASGGTGLMLPDGVQQADDKGYPGLYAQCATLIRERRSDVETGPLQLMADACLRAGRETVEAIED